MLTRIALIATGSVAALAGVGWLGLRIAPAPPPPRPGGGSRHGRIELPPDLPEPVRRYYRTIAGGEVVGRETAVVWGRGRLSLNGLWFPARFVARYDVPGRASRRDMELTWFGAPVFRGRDTFAEGEGRLRITGLFGLVDLTYEGEEMDQGANLAMWGELLGYAPSALLLDPGIRWEPIDAGAARLFFPFRDGEDSLHVEFDPETGLVKRMRGTRYRAGEEGKIPWLGEASVWKARDGVEVPHRLTATWEDRGRPYVVLDLEGVAYDAEAPGKSPGDGGRAP